MKRRPAQSTDIELASAGVHLPGTVLWLDARKKRDLSFVSHAFLPDALAHKRIIATEPTLRLLRQRLGRPLTGAIASPYRRPLALGKLTLELFPSGHCLGAAQICVTRGGRRIGYARDLDSDPSPVAPSVEVMRCDVLTLQSPPSRADQLPQDALTELLVFARGALGKSIIPVVLCHGPVSALEAMRRLSDAGHTVRAPRGLWRVARIHEERGVTFPNAGPLSSTPGPREVVVMLEPSRKPPWWASGERPVAEHRLPYFRRADLAELVRYAKETRAGKVFTVGQTAHGLADALEEAKISAEPLIDPEQLQLF